MPPEFRLQEWSLSVARVPFVEPFSHSSHIRTASESVLLHATSSRGELGWGEAAPRRYVTGETIESVVEVLAALDWASWSFDGSLDERLATIAAISAAFLQHHAGSTSAAAALETALLDLVCKSFGIRMVEVLSGGSRSSLPPLTLTLDAGSAAFGRLERIPDEELEALHVVKVKVGADLDAAIWRLSEIRRALPSQVQLVADANGAWSPPFALARVHDLRMLGLSWLEEPFPPRQWSDLKRLESAGIPVMADESFIDEGDLGECANAGVSYINIRVSKCGGPLRSLRLAERAREAGIGIQMGVQVGEVGPLWAVGRAVAAAIPSLVAVEAGRQDEWFLEPLTIPRFSVDRTAQVAPVPDAPGHGVRPAPALEKHLAFPPRHALRPGADDGRK